MHRLCVAAISVMALVILSLGCAKQHAGNMESSRPPVDAALELPGVESAALALPSPLEVLSGTPPRSTAWADYERASYGSQFLNPYSSRVSAEGQGAMFNGAWNAGNPRASDLAYALYKFELPGYSGAPHVGCGWTVWPGDGLVWYGLGNFQLNRWEWRIAEPEGINFGGGATYIGPGGSVLIIVLVLRSGPCGPLDWVRLGQNAVPSVSLSADPNPSAPAQIVTFNASAFDVDGWITDYEWDLNGNGMYNSMTLETNARGSSLATATYSSPDSLTVRVRVTDNLGATSEASVVQSVQGANWYTSNVDVTRDTGHNPSLIELDGRPAVAYVENGDLGAGIGDKLIFRLANDPHGLGWGPARVVDETVSGSWIQEPSLLLLPDGRPAIAYDNYNLRFVVANDTNGTSWGVPVDIGSGGSFSSVNALWVEAANAPAISYINLVSGVMFIRANNSTGTDWPSNATTVRSGFFNIAGAHPALVGGKPAIAYGQGFEVLLSVSGDTHGNGWPATPVTVDGDAQQARACFLYAAGTVPMLTYSKVDSNEFKVFFRLAGDAGGTTWGPARLVDGAPSGGTATQLVLFEGRPLVAHMRSVYGDLRVIHANASDGASWGLPVVVDADGWTWSRHFSLALVGGKPAIAYKHVDSISWDFLKFAIYY